MLYWQKLRGKKVIFFLQKTKKFQSYEVNFNDALSRCQTWFYGDGLQKNFVVKEDAIEDSFRPQSKINTQGKEALNE